MARLRLLLLVALTTVCAGAYASSAPALTGHARSHRARTHHSVRCAGSSSFRARHRAGHRATGRRKHHGGCHKAKKRHGHRLPSSAQRPLGKTPAQQTSAVGNDGSCTGTGLIPEASDLDQIRSATLCLVNRERIAHGESPLQENTRLERAAQGHTESMAFGDYFEHVGPRGETPLSRMRAAGYIYSTQIGFDVGENIAWGTLWEATPRAIVAGWMASPGHRANILDPRFHDTAIGVAPHPPASLSSGQAGAIYTQDFGVIVTG